LIFKVDISKVDMDIIRTSFRIELIYDQVQVSPVDNSKHC